MKTLTVSAALGLMAAGGLAVALAQVGARAQASAEPPAVTAAAQPAVEKGSAPAQPATAEKVEPAQKAAPTNAEAPMYDSFDGTQKLAVVSRSEITLVMEDLKVGEGKECPPGATVEINYHGQLTDGFVFDTTRGKQPATFPLARLIQGWQLGIPGMKEGGIRRLTIPSQLGYGPRDVGQRPDGTGPLIPANSTLVFTIELKSVK